VLYSIEDAREAFLGARAFLIYLFLFGNLGGRSEESQACQRAQENLWAGMTRPLFPLFLPLNIGKSFLSTLFS